MAPGSIAIARMIAIDWGSSAFRAFLLDGDCEILGRASTSDGVSLLGDKPYNRVLEESCGKWLDVTPGLPVIMGGTIGSRNGWKETPYVSCNASINTLAASCVRFETDTGLSIQIVPGVSGPNFFGGLDVMRGEELQIFGALESLGLADALVCLPGTHSKWCVVEQGEIISLTSFMTGEMFALIRRQSMIGTLLVEEEFDLPSFMAGVAASGSGGGLLHNLFSIRADILLGELACKSAESYLSGMLVGSEVKAAVGAIGAGRDVVLVGNGGLASRYTAALTEHAVASVSVPAEHAFVGGIALLKRAQTDPA